MTAINRQNALFVAEDWRRIYEAIQQVDFTAYDSETLVGAIMEYIKVTHPDEFNDWIASSEFIMMVEILAWLHQNIAYRIDLNARENVISTAERRESIIRLAQNVGYKIDRVRPATGFLKIVSVSTTQELYDSNDVNLAKRTIRWGDPKDEDWFERFILIMNSAMLPRTQFTRPFTRFVDNSTTTESYLLSSVAPAGGVYAISSTVNKSNLRFDIYNGLVDEETGVVKEMTPLDDNVFAVLYRDDGNGISSVNTGFFLPFKQGQLLYQDVTFTNALGSMVVDITSPNVNETDIYVLEYDKNGNVVDEWTRVDSVYGEGVSFFTAAENRKVFEVDTLPDDKARIRFGDGTFGRIPNGRFRIWYRVSNPTPVYFRNTDFKGTRVSIPYIDRDNRQQTLTLTLELGDVLSTGVPSESNLAIRNRVGKVFYTQNRMITAADYNNMYLRDNNIRKVKVTNRSFAGHSRYTRIYESTGIYDNLRQYADDGRLFKDYLVNVQVVSASTDIMPTMTIIEKYVQPALNEPGKDLMYRDTYPMIPVTSITEYIWKEDKSTPTSKFGHIEAAGNPVPVGANAVGELSNIVPDAIIRVGNPYGPVFYVNEITGDGTGNAAIAVGGTDIKDGDRIYQIFPPMRTVLIDTEKNEIDTRLKRRQNFGMSWDQTSNKWIFISESNLDKVSDFSIANQGDNSGQGRDASWMIRFELESSDVGDNWRIINRNLAVGFESSEEIDFVLANLDEVIDPITGKSLYDEISLMPCNESKNSPNRLGNKNEAAASEVRNVFNMTGNGVDTVFELGKRWLDPSKLIVTVDDALQAYTFDYDVVEGQKGTTIVFKNPPAPNAKVFAMYAPNVVHVNAKRFDIAFDGTTTQYLLPNVTDLNQDNIFVTLDGITQETSVDYTIRNINNNTYLTVDDPLSAGVVMRVHVFEGIDTTLFSKSEIIGDGVTDTIPLYNITKTNADSIILTIDGVNQAPSTFTYDSGTNRIKFHVPFPLGTHVRAWSVKDTKYVRVINKEYIADGITNRFSPGGTTLESITGNGNGVLVFLDGVMQAGPQDSNPAWTFDHSTGDIVFTNTPAATEVVHIIAFASVIGFNCNYKGSAADILRCQDIDVIAANDLNNDNLYLTYPFVAYFGRSVPFRPIDILRHVDGYTNVNGLSVIPLDRNKDAKSDFPFIFRDIVIDDGKTDLVLWRKVMVGGVPTWYPLDEFTTPRGLYGVAADDAVVANTSFDTTKYSAGDVYYDTVTETWYEADKATGNWVVADSTNYKKRIGRSGLKFVWTHYSSQETRIDPSVSNVMDVFILTSGYYDAYKRWILANDSSKPEPVPESSRALATQFASFLDVKPVSDSVIYHPVRMKALFGPLAVPEVQARIVISQTPGSTISTSDLKLRILNTINDFFSLERWELGETLYISELISYIHQQVAPHLQSIHFEPKYSESVFELGNPVIRSEPDEIFVSAATLSDIVLAA